MSRLRRPDVQFVPHRRVLNCDAVSRRCREMLAGDIAASVAVSATAIAQARTRVRVAYLHVVAVDSQIFTGLDRGSFDRQGIDFELVERNMGPRYSRPWRAVKSRCCRPAA